MSDSNKPQNLHASAVALNGRGLLILGRSGAGKSVLTLEMIARGATLVADDRVWVAPQLDGPPLMSAPSALHGLIEARGIGLIAQPAVAAPLSAVVDLDQVEADRLPDARETVIAGYAVPCLWRVEHPAFASMLTAYLQGERVAP